MKKRTKNNIAASAGTYYQSARKIFYNARVNERFIVDLGTRTAFYKVAHRHKAKTTFRLFKSRVIKGSSNYTIIRFL